MKTKMKHCDRIRFIVNENMYSHKMYSYLKFRMYLDTDRGTSSTYNITIRYVSVLPAYQHRYTIVDLLLFIQFISIAFCSFLRLRLLLLIHHHLLFFFLFFLCFVFPFASHFMYVSIYTVSTIYESFCWR